MNEHQYYETLIFSEEVLTDKEQNELEQHLESCASCSTLREGWESGAALLCCPAPKQPAAGFIDRWNSFYKQKLIEKKEKNTRKLIIGAIVILTIACAFSIALLASPKNLMMVVSTFSTLMSSLTGIGIQVRTLASIIRTPLLIIGVGAVSLSLTIAFVGLLFMKKSVTIRQGVQKNE